MSFDNYFIHDIMINGGIMDKIFTQIVRNSFSPSEGNFPGNRLYLPEDIMEWAARICYKSIFKFNTAPDFITKILISQHYDVIEHGYFGFVTKYEPTYNTTDILYFEHIMRKMYPFLRVDTFDHNRNTNSIGIYGNMRAWMDVSDKEYQHLWGIIPNQDMQETMLTLHCLAPSIFAIPEWLHSQNKIQGADINKEYAQSIEDSPIRSGIITKTGANIALLGLAKKQGINRWHATFQISGVSRSFSHQIVRHRLLSFSQESQRYVDGSDFKYVLPSAIQNAEKIELTEIMKSLNSEYKYLRNTLLKEDARCVLPNAAMTQMVVSGEETGWNHFLKLRCAKDAQEEIREVAFAIKELLEKTNE